MPDKNENSIYEGDIVKCEVVGMGEDVSFIGLVSFAPEFSSYIVLRFNPDEFYVLGTDVNQYVEIIGNIFDNGYLISKEANENNGNKDYGKQAL